MNLDIETPAAREAIADSGTIPDFGKSALYELELENSGLRRLVLELLEKNQKLRELAGFAEGV